MWTENVSRENMDRETFFSLFHNARTQRGHPMKLMGGRFRTDKRTDFFTQHIVKLWNSTARCNDDHKLEWI